MKETYAVVGVEGSGIQPRLEIRDLQQNPIQFSLFIQAFNKVSEMRDQDPNDSNYYKAPNSWWEMGAIHGLPFEAWTGDPKGPQTADTESPYGGYCFHQSALFPTWHRVLVLLVEQALVNEAISIATETRNDEWLQAAKTLRFPFWDWTRFETAEEGIPKIFQQTTISIVTPGGLFKEIKNPLNHYCYVSEPGEVKGFEYMSKWGRTFRWVNDITNPTEELYEMSRVAFSEGVQLRVPGFSEPWQLKPVDWLREKVAGLFDYPLNLENPSYGPNLWGHFSNAASSGVYVPTEAGLLASIEEPHNKVHLNVGGVGSMSLNPYAGFDPIFYFHHCNIDRIYAFWEYLYPEYWMDDGWMDENDVLQQFRTGRSGNFSQDPGASTNHATQLIPFRNKDLLYWNSDNARGLLTTSPTQKYYTYPAIEDPVTGVAVKVDVPYDVEDTSLRMKFQRALQLHWGTSHIVDTVREICRSGELNPQLCKIILQENEHTGSSYLRNFTFVGEVPEFAFPGSYHLELYLLPSVTKHATPQVINSVSVLGRADPSKCAACKGRQAAGSRVRGVMHINPIVVLYLISLYRPEDSQDRWPNLPMPNQLEGDVIDKDWVASLIQLSVGVRLVQPDKTPLAVTDPMIALDGTLDESKQPRVTLHSRRIDLTPPEERSAMSGTVHENITDHGPLVVDGGWKAY